MSLADTILNLEPIESQLTDPIGFTNPLSTTHSDKLASLSISVEFSVMANLFEAAGLRIPKLYQNSDQLTVFNRIVTEALNVSEIEQLDIDDPETSITLARGRSTGAVYNYQIITSNDGTQLSVKQTGRVTGEPMLFFGAPGTPSALISGWLKGLGKRYCVSTWETRGLFGPNHYSVNSLGINAQVMDAKAVMDNAEWDEGHIVGICGGAVLALAFAAAHPARVRSLSLWFGDYELGDRAPKTDHQQNLQALMKMVVDKRVSINSMREMLLSVVSKLSEPDLAPMALYPYANSALLGQYCHMNYPIMSTNCIQYLERIKVPSLVVFSPNDVTTHSDGSYVVANYLGAKLESVVTSGHLGAFRGNSEHIKLALSFHQECDRYKYSDEKHAIY